MPPEHATRGTHDKARADRDQYRDHGRQAVIRGTRVPVDIVLRKLGAGMTPEAIMADHPRLTAEDIRAAQTFAADYLTDGADW
jgi:uncharacterized protein (DUF433 family)